jgi:thioredoxin reductase (NADPH)
VYYDLVIIGGGPAGLTAAVYASRARLKSLLIGSISVPSQAMLTEYIENYPGFPDGINGFELLENFKRQAEVFGAESISGTVQKIEAFAEKDFKGWKIEADGKAYISLSIIIASGARPKRLNLPGEERLTGRGVSYCATCDAALYKNKDVVVIGGGDSAIEEALFLTKFVNKVSVIHRRDALRATKVLQERAFGNKKIDFIWSSIVTEIIGGAKVSGLKIKNIKTDKETELCCEGVFIFAGYVPNTDFAKGLLELDEEGYIITDGNMATSKKGIFACGDCRKKLLRQVVTACADGAIAAFSAQQYLEGLEAKKLC